MSVCFHCDEPILEDERSPLFPDTAVHHECGFRMVTGSAAHQLGECTCYGGSREDPAGMSKRDAARLSLETYRMLHNYPMKGSI
jgi:hypothetical protein